MNERHRRSIQIGFLLVVVATLFPPWRYRYPGSSYGFLFAPPDNASGIDLTRLLVEWMLIVFVMGGLSFGWTQKPKPERAPDATSSVPSKRRMLLGLATLLAILVASLSLTTYIAVRKMKRLEAGIQNVKVMIGELLPPTHPVGKLTPVYGVQPKQASKPPLPSGYYDVEAPSEATSSPESARGNWYDPQGNPHLVAYDPSGKMHIWVDAKGWILPENWVYEELEKQTNQLRQIKEELDKLK
jgi:hypothetical protein